MTRTKKTSLGAAAVLASASMLLAGCGGSTGTSGGDATSASGDCASKDVFCVGLVTDLGKVDDKSFNQSAHEGVEAAIKDIKGAQSKVVETTDTKDYANNIKQFTDKKYDVVVTVGFLMAEATTKAATDYPDTHFIGVDQFQSKEVKNLTGLTFPEDKAGYAAGFLAGSLSKSNKIGQVLGMQIPPVEKYAKGYEAGAKKAKPDISVATVYHPAGDNAFTDPAWGAAEAQKQLDQGADVIFGAGGKTGNGALGAVAKSPSAGTSTYCIGVDTDQWSTVPEAQKCLVTSAMKNITSGVTDILKEVNGGTAKGGNFTGTTGLAPYHDFDSKVPADVKTKVDEVVKGLEDGSIQTGVKVG